MEFANDLKSFSNCPYCSKILADMLSFITYEPNSVDSVSIIRNGYMVLDTYFYPYHKNKTHVLHSCTKSITSTPVGIGIDKGYIKAVHQKLLGLFPEINAAKISEDKKNISLENILTIKIDPFIRIHFLRFPENDAGSELLVIITKCYIIFAMLFMRLRG